MSETAKYHTRTLDRSELLDELAFVSTRLMEMGVIEVDFMLGWGCLLPIDLMWKGRLVPADDLRTLVTEAERGGKLVIGEGDVWVTLKDFSFLLCHEGDVHVKGTAPLVHELAERWKRIGIDGPV